MKKERGLALAACAALAALMLLFASQCSPLYPINLWDDANCLLTVGRVMQRGGVLYRDIYEQKGPLLYLIHALAACISDTSFWGVYVLEIPALTAALYSRLSDLRKQIAMDQNVPPFIIFTNATLKDMAAKAPRTRAQMLRVAGVGEGKMQRYGDAFLREIAAYEEDEA